MLGDLKAFENDMWTLKYEKYFNSHGAQPVHLEGPTMKLLEGHGLNANIIYMLNDTQRIIKVSQLGVLHIQI